VRIAARPETVFAYFTDPERMVRWFGIEATLDPRPGGLCRVTFGTSEAALEALQPSLRPLGPATAQLPDEAVMSGRFVEVEPYSRISFTWGWEEEMLQVPPQSTLVSVLLEADRDSGTLVRVVHDRLPAHSTAFHTAGWKHYLARLASVAAGATGADPWQRSA
jgi:uncharacterized protein YndB with AHSA1/START domain